VTSQCVNVMKRCIRSIEYLKGFHSKVLDYKTRKKRHIMTTKYYYYSACSTHFIINKDEASAIQKRAFHFEVTYHPPDSKSYNFNPCVIL
jgi:hypothetical protein